MFNSPYKHEWYQYVQEWKPPHSVTVVRARLGSFKVFKSWDHESWGMRFKTQMYCQDLSAANFIDEAPRSGYTTPLPHLRGRVRPAAERPMT